MPLEEMLDADQLIPFVAIVGGLSIGVIAIVLGTIKSICVTRAREQTKREIAAYVAEGTLEPDRAVAIINAGRPKWEVGTGDPDVAESHKLRQRV